MFDIAWSELAIIAVVALVVIGPKDLPRVLAVAGSWVRKARLIASDFQSQIEQMARDAELAEMRKKIEEASAAADATDLAKTIANPASILVPEALQPPVAAPMETPVVAETAVAAEAPEPLSKPAPEPSAALDLDPVAVPPTTTELAEPKSKDTPDHAGRV
jgi:sec-independent protein translocase protein TatB